MNSQITCPHCGKIAATIELIDAPRRTPIEDWLIRNVCHTPKTFLTFHDLVMALRMEIVISDADFVRSVTAVFGVKKTTSHERQGFKGLSLK